MLIFVICRHTWSVIIEEGGTMRLLEVIMLFDGAGRMNAKGRTKVRAAPLVFFSPPSSKLEKEAR